LLAGFVTAEEFFVVCPKSFEGSEAIELATEMLKDCTCERYSGV
jgi:hypothetical protein